MKIKIKFQRWENQGIQFRARFWIGFGVGPWWKIGLGWFTYNDGKWEKNPVCGGWVELMLGWWMVLFTFPSFRQAKGGER